MVEGLNSMVRRRHGMRMSKRGDVGQLNSIGIKYKPVVWNSVDSFGHGERRSPVQRIGGLCCAVLYVGCDVRNALP